MRADGLEYLLGEQAKPAGNLVFVTNGTRWPGAANLYVSLFSLHKGPWENRRVLDGRDVVHISAMFEDYADAGPPKPLRENDDRMFQGSIFLGDGFLLTHQEAEAMRSHEPSAGEVIFPVINGQELNNPPDQTPGREVINFSDWSLERAQEFPAPFERVERLVKPIRDALREDSSVNKRRRERWWQFGFYQLD